MSNVESPAALLAARHQMAQAFYTDVKSIKGVWNMIEHIAGREGARRIIDRKGGITVYIPKTCGDDHWLAQCVGTGIALEIGRALGAARVDVPTRRIEKRNDAIKTLRAEGKSGREIARELGINERTVRRHVPAAKEIARIKGRR